MKFWIDFWEFAALHYTQVTIKAHDPLASFGFRG